ncbi:MAG: hypothetical protein COA69_12365 [Robiginitomaculum sp.]|nr:MAG: hypothetical protein COA69_12365 [Robiginitomaculum sp.]
MKTMVLNIIERFGLFRVMRYGLVGICAASAHAGMAFLAHRQFHLDPTISNFAGFLSGAVISYLGSYYFTFKSTEGHGRSLPRFALVWLIGIAINIGLFKTLLTAFNVPFGLNVFIAIVVTPIAQYLMLRFWAFKDSVD